MCTVSEKAEKVSIPRLKFKEKFVEYDVIAHYKQCQIEIMGKFWDCTEEANYLTNCSTHTKIV